MQLNSVSRFLCMESEVFVSNIKRRGENILKASENTVGQVIFSCK